MRMICSGKSPKQIAAELKTTDRAVHKRIRQLCRKLGVEHREALLLWVFQEGAGVLRRGALIAPGLHPAGCECSAVYCTALRSSAA